MHWRDFQHGKEAVEYFQQNVALRIRQRKLDLGRRHYALTLTMGVMSAVFCNVGRIVAVEFGVGRGNGLLDLCKAAAFFRSEIGMEIDVYGLDNASGLPPPTDYRDHPEIWRKGQFRLLDPEALRAKLPPYGHLVVGDVADTTQTFRDILGKDKPLAFASVDVDYYSSTVPCLEILRHDASCYMPTVPMYFDDFMATHLTSNAWCGEALAIAEFNRDNAMRKIQENRLFNTMSVPGRPYHGCHVLDHPLRTGRETTRPGFAFEFLHFV